MSYDKPIYGTTDENRKWLNQNNYSGPRYLSETQQKPLNEQIVTQQKPLNEQIVTQQQPLNEKNVTEKNIAIKDNKGNTRFINALNPRVEFKKDGTKIDVNAIREGETYDMIWNNDPNSFLSALNCTVVKVEDESQRETIGGGTRRNKNKRKTNRKTKRKTNKKKKIKKSRRSK